MLEVIFNYLIYIYSLTLLTIIIYDTDPTMTPLLVYLFPTGDLHKRSMDMSRNFLTSFNQTIIIYKKLWFYFILYFILNLLRNH